MTDAPAATVPEGVPRISIGRIRSVIVIVLTASVLAFTGGVFLLVERIFDNFGPRVREDLIWKTVRGAQELARASDLGFAMADGATVGQAFGDYRSSRDVLAIVAVTSGRVLASHGTSPEPTAALFRGPPGLLRETSGYFVSWAGSFIEQTQVGRVAVVVGTGRLVESRSLLRRVQLGTAAAGLLTWLGGLWFVSFFAGAIVKRDQQLASHAATLEHEVAQRTAELGQRNRGMRLVLDHVNQGFITVDRLGVMERERSAIIDRWLGPPAEGQSFADYLGAVDPRAGRWFGLNMEAIREDQMPLEVILDQMPKRVSIGQRTMRVEYIPISDGQLLRELLIVMSDVTAELAGEQLEREQRELAGLFQSIRRDRAGFVEFLEEAGRLVRQIARGSELGPLVEKRLVHTLKGACSLFKLTSVAETCHAVEGRLTETGGALTSEDRREVERAWKRIAHHARELLGEGPRNLLELSPEDYQRIRSLVASETPHRQLSQVLDSWRLEPIAVRLERLGKEGQSLARRLHKTEVDVVIDSDEIRLSTARFRHFFTTLIQVVRNAVDHGIEAPEQRRACGKPTAGKLTFRSRILDGRLIISIADDGAGIDWQRVAAKAREAGLPHETEEQLTNAVFSDGLSTKEEITLVSGRGVGLAAVRSSLTAVGGTVQLRSQPGQGTTFEFSLPATDALSDHQAVVRTPGPAGESKSDPPPGRTVTLGGEGSLAERAANLASSRLPPTG